MLIRPTIPQKPDSSGRSSMTVPSGTAASSARRSAKTVPGALNRMSFTPAPQVTRSGGRARSERFHPPPVTARGAPQLVQRLADVAAVRSRRAQALRGRVAQDGPQRVGGLAPAQRPVPLAQHPVIVRGPVGGELDPGGAQLGHAV